MTQEVTPGSGETYAIDTASASNVAITVGITRESFPEENRVALVPQSVAALRKAKLNVVVEAGAGIAAGFGDNDYAEQGGEILGSRRDVFSRSDVLVQVRTAGANLDAFNADLELLRENQTIIGLCDPLGHPQVLQRIAALGMRTFALELLPRITRAQSMDVLSSQASIGGYKAVLLAANVCPKLFPMMMTAAGTITAAKVCVIGAGVAGLQAIATARRLGAVVKATDVRSAAKDDVLSLGAKFVDMGLSDASGAGGYATGMSEDFYQRQQAVLAPLVAESDVVITTAAVPGKKAPRLISATMARSMSRGSVIIDMAAEQGGNCELTQPRSTIVENGVTIIGCGNLPASVPFHASQMFSRNVTTFLLFLVKEGHWSVNHEDEIVQGTLVTDLGHVVHPKLRDLISA